MARCSFLFAAVVPKFASNCRCRCCKLGLSRSFLPGRCCYAAGATDANRQCRMLGNASTSLHTHPSRRHMLATDRSWSGLFRCSQHRQRKPATPLLASSTWLCDVRSRHFQFRRTKFCTSTTLVSVAQYAFLNRMHACSSEAVSARILCVAVPGR